MQALIEVILPVFLVIGFGYVAVWAKWVSDELCDMVMKFAQTIAVPSLLFVGIARMDLGTSFQMPLLVSFYAGAFAAGGFCFCVARFGFKRDLPDCVAIGFTGIFSNAMLLGVPITERAYGADALAWNFAIISIHAPIFFAIGVTLMEISKSRGMGLSSLRLARQIGGSLAKNPMVIGISLGWLVNIGHIPLPQPVWDAVFIINRAAIPTALFALGGILLRYRPEGDMRIIAWVVFATLLIHPSVTFILGRFAFDLETGPLRSAAMTAAMAPGVNAFVFANMYGVGKRIAASSVLIATVLSIGTIWVWLIMLP